MRYVGFVFVILLLRLTPSASHGVFSLASEKPQYPSRSFRLIPRSKWNYVQTPPLSDFYSDETEYASEPAYQKDSALKTPPRVKPPTASRPPPPKSPSPGSGRPPTPKQPPKAHSPPPYSSDGKSKPPTKKSPPRKPPPKKSPPVKSPSSPSTPKKPPPTKYPPKQPPSPTKKPPLKSPPRVSKPPPTPSPVPRHPPPPSPPSSPRISPPFNVSDGSDVPANAAPPLVVSQNYPTRCDNLSYTPKGYQGICYMNGPMLIDPINIYLIWYGNWSNPLDGGQNIIRNFFSSISAQNVAIPNKPALRVADWWQTVKLYPNLNNQTPSLNVTLKKEYQDSKYSMGNVFPDDYKAILTIIVRALNDPNGLPYDPSGLYIVICSHDVVMQSSTSAYGGFCGNGYEGYCGNHNQGQLKDSNNNLFGISLGWMGNPITQCPNSCIPQYPYPPPDPLSKNFTSTSPNGNWAADGIVAILAHEVAEAATNLNSYSGWNGPNGGIADLCSYAFGEGVGGTLNGLPFVYNMVGVNNSKFLIQQLWDAINVACVSQTKIPTSFVRT